VYRYVLMVDGKPIEPTIPPVEVDATRVNPVLTTSTALSTPALPMLSAGIHRIQVMAQASPGVLVQTRNQALIVIGVVD
jgi:hypothetical protein